MNIPSPEALESYALIFEAPRGGFERDEHGQVTKIRVPPSEACIAAAFALRFLAAAQRLKGVEPFAPGGVGSALTP